jgi:hypothetical protein
MNSAGRFKFPDDSTAPPQWDHCVGLIAGPGKVLGLCAVCGRPLGSQGMW